MNVIFSSPSNELGTAPKSLFTTLRFHLPSKNVKASNYIQV